MYIYIYIYIFIYIYLYFKGNRWKAVTTTVRNQRSRDKINVHNIGHRYFSPKFIPLISSSSKSSNGRHPVELEGLEETAV
jgi:hypothetical protein